MSKAMHVSSHPTLQLACWLVVASSLATLTQAQTLRDPTVPPVAAAGVVHGAAPGAVSALTSIQPGGMAVLVRDGVPYLVVGTRLYAKGQMVGQARIERISETEVWLRESGVVRTVPVFGGIHRQVSKPVPSVSRQSSSSPSVAQSKP